MQDIEYKVCTYCKIEKPKNKDYFYLKKELKSGFRGRCKECTKKLQKPKMLTEEQMIIKKNKRKEYLKKYNTKEQKAKKAEYDKLYRQKNKEKIAKYMSDYRKKYINKNEQKPKKTPEERKEYMRLYREANKEKIKEYRRNFDKDKKREFDKKYREQNKEKIKQKKKEYYEKNKEKIRRYAAERFQKNKEEIMRKQKIWIEKNRKRQNEIWGLNNQRRYAQKKSLKNDFTIEDWNFAKESFNNSCAYCGEKKKLEQDHFIPLIKNGAYTKNNIIPSCRKCNSSKNDKRFPIWYDNCENYSLERKIRIYEYLMLCSNGSQEECR